MVLSAVPAGLASYLFSSFLPLYIKEFEARMLVVSLFFSLQGIFNMVFAAVAGWQTDKHNRAMLHSVFTFLFSAGVLLVVVQYGNPFFLVGGLVIVSLSSNIIRTARYSLLVDFVPTEKRSSIFGLLNGVGNIFSVAGGIIGGILLLKANFVVLFLLIAALILVSGVIRLVIKDPKHQRSENPAPITFFSDFKKAYKAVFTHKGLTFLILGDIFIALAYSTTINFYGIYFKDVLGFDYDKVGFLISLFFVGIAVASFAGSVLSDKIGHEKALTGSVLINICFIFAFIYAKSFVTIGIIYFVLGMTGGIYAPNFFAILGDFSPEEHRGKIYSIQSINDSIFLIVAPIIGGILWDALFPLAAWYIDLVCTGVAGVIFVGLLRESGNMKRGIQ
jgi:MFS family permease